MNIIEEIHRTGILPFLEIDRLENACPAADALYKGGINLAEISFQTAAAYESVKAISNEYPDFIIGAGNVHTIQQVIQAVSAGADFVACLAGNTGVLMYCVDNGITVIPYCTVPDDIKLAQSLGFQVVKLCHTASTGVIESTKDILARYGNMKFIISGIGAAELKFHLDNPKVTACGGSWMADRYLIRRGSFHKIRELTQQTMNQLFEFKFSHIGINLTSDMEIDSFASLMNGLFGFEKKAGTTSVYSGDRIELMKPPYYGVKGHIGIWTNDLERSIHYLECIGFEFNSDSRKYDISGKLIVIYLNKTINGYAIHLLGREN